MATPPATLSLLLLFAFLSVVTSADSSAASTTTVGTTTTTTTSRKVHGSKGLSASKATDFIWTSCQATRYPTLCYHSLSSYADLIQHSPRQLALTALSVGLSRARSASLFVSKLTRVRGIKHREFEAVKDCVENMGDSVDELRHSVHELGQTGSSGGGRGNGDVGGKFSWHLSNVETWVSAALTDQQTCVDGFGGHAMDGNVKADIRARVVGVAQVTSNALALVNRFANGH